MAQVQINAVQVAQTGAKYARDSIALSTNNIVNAQQEGYTVKRLAATTKTANGTPLGIEYSAPLRDVDQNRVEDMRLKCTRSFETQKTADLYRLVDQRLGQPGDGEDLGSSLTHIKAAITVAVNAPDQPWAQGEVINLLNQTTQKIKDLGNFYQQQRFYAEQDIALGVDRVNKILNELAEVNKQAVIADSGGRAAADYLDRQDMLCQELSEYLNVKIYRDDLGAMRITTASGKAMMVRDQVFPLTFVPSLSISATTNPSTLSQIVLDGANINGDINSGLIKSALDWRDTKITNEYQAPLDELATQFRDTMNAVHNRGVGFPPRQDITGERIFTTPGVSTIQMSGQVRVALVDRTTGDFVAGINPLDLDLTAGPVTINAMVNQLNTHFTTGGFGTATLNPSGQLNLNATNANHGFAIVSLGATAGQVSYDAAGGAPVATGMEFSHFLGLNNLVTSGDRYSGDGNASKAGISVLLGVRSDIKATPALLSRGTLYNGVIPTTDKALTLGQNDILIGLKDVFDTKITYAGAGVISAGLTETLTDYANTLYQNHAITALAANNVNDSAQLVFTQTKLAYAAETGVNTVEEMTKLFDVQFYNALCLKCIEVARAAEDELLSLRFS